MYVIITSMREQFLSISHSLYLRCQLTVQAGQRATIERYLLAAG